MGFEKRDSAKRDSEKNGIRARRKTRFGKRGFEKWDSKKRDLEKTGFEKFTYKNDTLPNHGVKPT